MKKAISYFSIAILVSFVFASVVYAVTVGESLAFSLSEGEYVKKHESLDKGYGGTSATFSDTKNTTAGISITKDRVLLGEKLLKRCNVNVKFGSLITCKYTKEKSSGMHIGTIVRNSGTDNTGTIEGFFYLKSDTTA